MDIDIPTLTRFLSLPLRSIEIALPVSLGGQWSFGSKVRTNFAAIRTDEGTLLFHYGLTPDPLLDGIWEDNPAEGYAVGGSLRLIRPDNLTSERDELAYPRPFQSPEALEMIPLENLFPDEGRIFVPEATACEITYSHTIRDGAFRLDVSGIRIYSCEASTLIERGNGGVLECSVTA